MATKKIILYFSATGNSLYVARELGGENAEILSIPQMIKQNRYEFEADEIGFVFPLYGHMPPNIVKNFVRKATLKANYLWTVQTYGMRHCNAVEIWDRQTREMGKPMHYHATAMLVDNYLPVFDMDEQRKIDKQIPEQLARIKADLAERKTWIEPVTQEERDIHNRFLEMAGINEDEGFSVKSEVLFNVTDKCIGCSICVKVCPRGNYNILDKHAVAQGDCESCYACIHHCPQKAIQFSKTTGDPFIDHGEKNPNARYRNDNVSVADIIKSNNQF